MNHGLKNQNCLKIAKFLSSRLFRSCMAGIVILCLAIIAVPDHSYGEEASSQDTNVTNDLSDADEDTEDTNLDDVDLEEIPEEEDAQDLEETPKEEDTQDGLTLLTKHQFIGQRIKAVQMLQKLRKQLPLNLYLK